jgi:hypothetical protein
MAMEIAMLQRMSIFLGHPIYSLSIVLFAIIFTTGLGSLLSDRFRLKDGFAFAAWSGLTGSYLLFSVTWMPPLLANLEGEALVVRALVCVGFIAPAGVLMGYGFPTGMRLISAVNPKPTPWFWGINGAAGVLAASFAILCSLTFGIGANLMVAALCYWLLIPAAWTIGFSPDRDRN